MSTGMLPVGEDGNRFMQNEKCTYCGGHHWRPDCPDIEKEARGDTMTATERTDLIKRAEEWIISFGVRACLGCTAVALIRDLLADLKAAETALELANYDACVLAPEATGEAIAQAMAKIKEELKPMSTCCICGYRWVKELQEVPSPDFENWFDSMMAINSWHGVTTKQRIKLGFDAGFRSANHLHPANSELQAQAMAKLERENRDIFNDATYLFNAILKRWYPDNHVTKAGDTTRCLLTQIDNACTGIREDDVRRLHAERDDLKGIVAGMAVKNAALAEQLERMIDEQEYQRGRTEAVSDVREWLTSPESRFVFHKGSGVDEKFCDHFNLPKS